MAQEQVTIKTSPLAKEKLKLVSALAKEKQYQVLERLLAAEETRLLFLKNQQKS